METEPNAWVVAGTAAEITRLGCLVLQFGGKPVVVFAVEGTFYAIDDFCSHRGGPLSEGQIEGTRVTCPWHGSRFELKDGKPICGPAVRPITTYSARVQEGLVWLSRRTN